MEPDDERNLLKPLQRDEAELKERLKLFEKTTEDLRKTARFQSDRADMALATVTDLTRRLQTAEGDLKSQQSALKSAETVLAKTQEELRLSKAQYRELQDTYRDETVARRQLGLGLEALQEQLKNCRCNEPATTQGMAVAARDLPGLPEVFHEAAGAALERFAEGYAEYGPGAADELGLAGQWGDLHRKVGKLKPLMWEGDVERLTRETPQDILRDIIGHCLLALEMIERGFTPGRAKSEWSKWG
jgi:hypothetical protein